MQQAGSPSDTILDKTTLNGPMQYEGDCDNPTDKKYELKNTRFGIWEVIYATGPEARVSTVASVLGIGNRFKCFLKPRPSTMTNLIDDYSGRYLIRLFKDMYKLAPRQFIIYMIYEVWGSLEDSISIYLTSKLLDSISEQIQNPNANRYSVLWTLGIRMACFTLTREGRRIVSKNRRILKSRFKYHFLSKLIRLVSSMELNDLKNSEASDLIDEHAAFQAQGPLWYAFEGVKDTILAGASIISTVTLAFSLVRTSNSSSVSSFFIALAALQPIILKVFASKDLYDYPFVTYCVNTAYARMKAMHNLIIRDAQDYQEDLISDGAGDFVAREFEKHMEILGDENTDHANLQWDQKHSNFLDSYYYLVEDIPIIAMAIKVFFNPQNVSISSITMVQRISQTISDGIGFLFYQSRTLSQNLSKIRSVYKLLDKELILLSEDGKISYPIEGKSQSAGMHVLFKDVSFSYPSTDKPVLSNLSFEIPAGSLVVIVGVNGSGKSSLTKLLNRLHDVTEGEIIIDGHNIKEYKREDLRRAVAMLRQFHEPYPLTLRENISLGLPGRDVSPEELQAALQKGGAEEFVSKLEQGLDTILNPVSGLQQSNLDEEQVAELKEIIEEKKKDIDISGGEKQRLAASRTFLRLGGGNARLLIADEPTSALDPEAEYNLFTRIREQRGQMTSIFITHRFGHLTRHADLILCLKDGKLIESGSHQELLARKGEYFKLHDVQAKAFQTS